MAGLSDEACGTAVGLSQGKLSADASGGAGYQMPIVVSPGTAGIQPKLAFQYSTGGRNGALGMGWSIAGVSAITRAPQTLAQDGVVRGVDLTLNDRYSMDGQRLIVIAGTDGAAGSEYRTEINSFVKVISNGQSGNGPATLTAWTKSGLIYTFGGANGASYVPSGVTNGTILTWCLSKVQDQAGNYMTFQYSTEGNLLRVDYTMNDGASVASYASVVFTYDATRPDPAIGYIVGSPISLNQRLSRVTSYYGQQIVRQYDLSYEVSANTKKSRLISITEGTGTESYPPTQFGWDNDPSSVTFGDVYSGGWTSGAFWIQGDFNGDGACDLGKIKDGAIQIYKPQTGYLVAAGSTTLSGYATDDTWMQGDFSGDGKLDVLRAYGPSGAAVKFTQYTNAGTGGSGTTFSISTPTLQGTAVTFQPEQGFIAIDANGDGKLDIVNISGTNHSSGAAQALVFSVYLNNPNGNQLNTFVKQTWNISRVAGDLGGTQADYAQQYDQWFVGDFNGDGLPDLAKLWKDNNKQSVRVYLNQNGSFVSAQWINQSKTFFKTGTTPAYLWTSGDFNGDGSMDLVRIPKYANPDSSTTTDVFLSTGSATTKFAGPQAWLPLIVGSQYDPNPKALVQAGDYNADGRSDLMVAIDWGYFDPEEQQYHSGTDRSEYASNGGAAVPGSPGFYFFGGYSNEVLSPYIAYFKKWLTADFNGDGKEDLIHFRTIGGNESLNIYNSAPGYQDLLRTVTDGMGSATSIDYQPLTGVNGISVYTPSTDAVSPAINITIPMPVVASITYDNGLGAIGSAGSTYSVSYRYEGLKADPKRGMLGFRAVEAIDNRPVDNPNPALPPSGTPDGSVALHSKSWFKQGFPYTGMAERSVTYLAAPSATKDFTDNTGLLSRSDTIFANGPTENAKVFFPYAQDSHVYSYDLNGVATNDTETIVQRADHAPIDMYGNTWGSVVKTKDLPSANFFIKTTKSDYTVSTSNWRLGQVTGATVLSQAPGQPDITRTSGFAYDSSNGQVGSELIEPNGSKTSTFYEYDAFGNTKLASNNYGDIAPRWTQTDYDARGRFLFKTTNTLGHTESKEYDQRFGAVTAITGPNGLTDSASYDGFSRQISTARADGTDTTTTYLWGAGSNGPANTAYHLRVTPEDGPETITYFDRLGRETRRQSVAGNGQTLFLDTTYDYRGRKQTATNPYFSGTTPIFATTLYDALDRVRQVIAPSVDEGGNPVLTYLTNDYNGLVTTSTNPKNQATIATKDAAGHLRQVKDAANGTITYTYDALGQLTNTTDALGNATTITYDIRGRKTSVSDPDLGVWHYTYYGSGELETQTDAKNQTVTFLYDQLGRISERYDPTGDVTAWTYDNAPGKGIGKLASVAFTPATGSLLAPYSNAISYDKLGRPNSQTTLISGTTYTTGTSYDQFSRPEILTYPTGFQTRNVYGTNGYLTDIKKGDNSATYWTARAYDADGHITEEQYGNGIITDRVYLPENGLLKEIKSGVGLNFSVQNLTYNFDVIGNLKRRTDNNQTINGTTLTETFNYDNLNRLLNSQATGQTAPKAFTYNIIGNIMHKDDAGDYTYDTLHKHAVSTVNGGVACTYDLNGNMTSGFGRTLNWTWFNMPQRIQKGGGISSDFTYDPDHNRITQRGVSDREGSLVTTTYVGGGLFEKVDDGNTTRYKHYISSPTGRVAIYTQTYDQQTFVNTSDTKYLHKDHLGSIDVVTNESGTVLERDSFDAWGTRRKTDWKGPLLKGKFVGNVSIVTRGFTDHEELDAFDLVHMNGRIYDPGIGRFLSADPFVQAPAVTQNFNRYSYVVNNPLSYTDPTGFNIFGDFFNWLSGVFGKTGAQIILGVASIAIGIATAGAFTAIAGAVYAGTLSGLATAIVGGAGFGFGAGFSSTIMSGGSLGQAFQAGLIGAVIGGISGGIAHGLGSIPGAGEMWTSGHAAQTAGHAVLGGTVAEIRGDNFGSGALAAGLSAFFAPGINMIGGGSPEYKIARVAASAAIGGTAAEIGGGKFANGAVTAAFMRLYNEEQHLRAIKKFEMRWSKDATELLQANRTYVDKIAARAGVDPDLIRAIILRESSDGIYWPKSFNDMVASLVKGTEASFGYAQLGPLARLAAGLTIQEATTMTGSIRGAARWLAISTGQLQAVGISNPSIAQIASQYNYAGQLGQVSNYGREVAWAYDYVRKNW